MGTKKTQPVTSRFPYFTLLLAASSIIVYMVPALNAGLIFDRQAITSGEGWRLITGHMVHFSGSHLFLNLLIFGLAGWMIETEGYSGFRLLCILTALIISLFIIIFQQSILRYGGLSGIATAAIIFLCLHKVERQIPGRKIWYALLCIVALKTSAEMMQGMPLFAQQGQIRFHTVHSAHFIGGITAGVIYLVLREK